MKFPRIIITGIYTSEKYDVGVDITETYCYVGVFKKVKFLKYWEREVVTAINISQISLYKAKRLLPNELIDWYTKNINWFDYNKRTELNRVTKYSSAWQEYYSNREN